MLFASNQPEVTADSVTHPFKDRQMIFNTWRGIFPGYSVSCIGASLNPYSEGPVTELARGLHSVCNVWLETDNESLSNRSGEVIVL